ncbi:MAG TPA: hypothetical protein VIV66_13670 [Pyrinomonadaceae bacterium]
MLFIESKTLSHSVGGSGRINLLERLKEKGHVPVVRSARLNCFENTLLDSEKTTELESALAGRLEAEEGDTYVRGDFFCAADHVLFLIFDELAEGDKIRAGVVYDSITPEPFRKMDAFCHEVHELLSSQYDTVHHTVPDWDRGTPIMPGGFKRFVSRQDNDSLYTSLRKDTMTKRILAASRLEDEHARVFLRSAKEAHSEGYAAKLLTGETSDEHDFSIQKLEDAGLVEREVQVSCRKTGHALLRLPNANALVVVTVSDATCSECGAPIADEKVEEVIAPTRLASSLLEDGSWLVNRIHFLLREMGVPESEIAVGPSEGDGHGQIMANICGESFLMVARDGDLTPAFARWAIDLEIDTEASHLVVVATGRVHNQAKKLLLNHSRRRISAGRDFELVVADGPASAGKELRMAFDRVSQRVIAEQLCELDASLGLDVTQLIMSKFDLLRSTQHTGNDEHISSATSGVDDLEANYPFALAAGAGANSSPFIDVEASVSSATPSSIEAPPADAMDGQMIPDTHAP